MMTQVMEHEAEEDTSKCYLLHNSLEKHNFHNCVYQSNRWIILFEFLYLDGMQQFLVESEGGTVLIDCTNVTIVKADQPANKP